MALLGHLKVNVTLNINLDEFHGTKLDHILKWKLSRPKKHQTNTNYFPKAKMFQYVPFGSNRLRRLTVI